MLRGLFGIVCLDIPSIIRMVLAGDNNSIFK